MKRALWKDFIREIRFSIARFISIFVIVFIGVGFFAGIKSTAPDMKYSVDQYYDEYNMMDVRLLSTMGFTQEDIDAIQTSDGIESVQAGYFCDVAATVDSAEYVFTVHSLPGESDTAINRIKITQGRYPEKPGECVIEDSSVIPIDVRVGDTITVHSGKPEPITDTVLADDTYTVVGKAVTPYYLSYVKGQSEIGSGKVDFFMMIPEEDFILPYHTEVLATVEGARNLNAFSEEYKNRVSRIVTPLENLGIDRADVRLADIRESANEELDKAKNTYAEEKKKYEDAIREAEAQISQAEIDLAEGQTELETNKRNFDEYYQKATDQIARGEENLNQAQIEYDQAQANYNQTMDGYHKDLENLDDTIKDINQARKEGKEQINELEKRLDDPEVSEEEKALIQELIAYYKEYIGYIDKQIKMVNNLNQLSKEQTQYAEDQLAQAKAKLDQQRNELNNEKEKLRVSKRDAEAEFRDGQRRIDDGWVELEQSKIDLETQKEDGQKKIDDAGRDIAAAEDKIEELNKPMWYVLDRSMHYSFVDYEKTADRIDAIAKVFPAFFFIVASLVCLTTMTRMIDEQRGVIGTYKALGYSNTAIAMKYVLYAAIASLLGGICGLFLGLWIFPQVIYQSWSMMYTLPPLAEVRQIPLMVISVMFGLMVTTLSALLSCNQSLKETPALLMRPKSPKPGKQVFLEKIKFLWKRLSFSQKVTARNLFRYKKRFLMTVIGIIGCCALLLAGFGLNNSISQIVDKQYQQIFKYDLDMRYSPKADDKESVTDLLDRDENVLSYLESTKINADIRSNKDDIPISLIVPRDTDGFGEYITLRQRTTQLPIGIPAKGIVLTEKLAKELDARAGESVELQNDQGVRKKVIITDITENYVFHYAYMSESYYREVFLTDPERNQLMIRLKEPGTAAESALGSRLIANENVASLDYYSEASATFSDTVKILNSIVIVIIISAGLLALVVLYNLTNINICERIREIATLKVLGFYNREVSAYVYRESLIISLIGALAGLAAGIVLHRFIMVSIEQDGIMFGNYIEPISFLYAFALTIGFVLVVNLLMYIKLKSIRMVESLKSVE